MATFEEKAERLKKELEEATNDDQRRNLSREYELTLRLLRIIRGEVFRSTTSINAAKRSCGNIPDTNVL